jgi:citrate lyase subunit beta / citryl-CoA lyase
MPISNRPALMRSVLIFPANVPRFLEKARAAGADVLCLDLEDSVPPEEKAAAREAAAAAAESLRGGAALVYARVNGVSSGLLEDDLAAAVRPGLDGIVLSKADTPEMVQAVESALSRLERERGMEAGAVAIAPLIESAEAVMNCYAVCRASPRVSAALFGAEDYAADMGIERTPEGGEVLWARTQMAIACRASGIVPIDTPETDYGDEAALERGLREARSLGYGGKLLIHPAQVAAANRAFSPGEPEVARARALVEAFEREALAQGRASMQFDGRMIDTPMYRRARALLEWAEAAGRER